MSNGSPLQANSVCSSAVSPAPEPPEEDSATRVTKDMFGPRSDPSSTTQSPPAVLSRDSDSGLGKASSLSKGKPGVPAAGATSPAAASKSRTDVSTGAP